MKRLLAIILTIIIVMSFIFPAAGFTSVLVKSIKLNVTKITLNVGQTSNLKVTLTPVNTTQKKLTYASNNKNIATIDSTGKITAVKPGTAKIQVYTLNKSIFATCNVTVKMSQIKVQIFDRGNAPEGQGTVVDNKWTKYVNQEMEKQGIKVTFVPVLRKEEIPKLNIMLAANEAPDLIYTYSLSDYQRWADAGGLTDLTDLIEKNAPSVKKLYERLPYLKNFAAHKGRFFSILDGNDRKNMYFTHIRKDWLDIVGLKLPNTVDEFYNVLKVFKEKDPGKVGKEHVPMAISPYGASGVAGAGFEVYSLISGFGMESSDYVKTKDGKITKQILLPEYKDYLLFLNKLYKEGLIDSEFITDMSKQRSQATIFSGKSGVVSGGTLAVDTPSGNRLNHDMVAKFPNVEWVANDRLMDKDGKRHYYAHPQRWLYNMIPKTSKKTIEVLKYLEWQLAKGGETLYYGFENEHYIVKDEVKVIKDAAYNAKDKEWIKIDICLFKPIEDIRIVKINDPNTKFGENAYQELKLAKDKGIIVDYEINRPLQSVIKYNTQLVSISMELLNKIVISKTPAEDYEKFKAEYLKNGGQEVIDEYTKIYLEMKAANK